MFYTYVLQSLIDKKFYTGHTNNLQRRLKEHSEGKNFSTKHRRPFVLIFYEACLNQNDAIQRKIS